MSPGGAVAAAPSALPDYRCVTRLTQIIVHASFLIQKSRFRVRLGCLAIYLVVAKWTFLSLTPSDREGSLEPRVL